MLAAIAGTAGQGNRVRLATRVLPYLLLAVSTCLALAVPGPAVDARRQLVALCLVVAAIVWTLALDTLRPSEPDTSMMRVVYYVGRFVITTPLVALNPWFGVYAWIGYMDAVRFLRARWQFVGIVATSALMAGSETGGFPTGWSHIVAYLIVLAFNVVLVGAIAWVLHQHFLQSEERRVALVELAETNTRLQTALAENVGLHAQLLTQAREAGISDERQRMAQEIHDTIAQGLAGIITQLEAADVTPGAPAEWRRHHEQARVLARQSLTDARRSVQALRPEALVRAHLSTAVAGLAESWSASTGVAIVVDTTGDARPVMPELEVTLFRVAQEALANVAAHARARKVGLTLSYLDDVVVLDVRDDGVGFEPRTPRSAAGHGFGLQTMRERLRMVGGTLDIESDPGGGTALSASVPVEPAP